MSRKRIALVALIVYVLLLIKVMVLKEMPLVRIGSLMLNFGGTAVGQPNLIPFKTIIPYLLGRMGLIIGGINIVGNIILLVPIGYLLPMIFQDIKGRRMFWVAVLSGLVIEGMQVILHVGIFDIDDVILNGLGVMIGYWSFRYLPVLWTMMKTSRVVLAAVFIICVGMVALGYDVYQETQMKGPAGPGIQPMSPLDRERVKSDPNMANDPCRGTGGTGEITRIGQNDFSIRRKDGVEQLVVLTKETTIKSSTGTESPSALKPGIRVTLVTSDNDDQGRMVASFVLICKGT